MISKQLYYFPVKSCWIMVHLINKHHFSNSKYVFFHSPTHPLPLKIYIYSCILTRRLGALHIPRKLDERKRKNMLNFIQNCRAMCVNAQEFHGLNFKIEGQWGHGLWCPFHWPKCPLKISLLGLGHKIICPPPSTKETASKSTPMCSTVIFHKQYKKSHVGMWSVQHFWFGKF